MLRADARGRLAARSLRVIAVHASAGLGMALQVAFRMGFCPAGMYMLVHRPLSYPPESKLVVGLRSSRGSQDTFLSTVLRCVGGRIHCGLLRFRRLVAEPARSAPDGALPR